MSLAKDVAVDTGGTVRNIGRDVTMAPELVAARTSRSWDWVLQRLCTSGGGSQRCALNLLDVVLCDGVELREWYFSNRAGFVVRKSQAKRTSKNIRDRFIGIRESPSAVCTLNFHDGRFAVVDEHDFEGMMSGTVRGGPHSLQPYVKPRGSSKGRKTMRSNFRHEMELQGDRRWRKNTVKLDSTGGDVRSMDINVNRQLDLFSENAVRQVERAQAEKVVKLTAEYVVDDSGTAWLVRTLFVETAPAHSAAAPAHSASPRYSGPRNVIQRLGPERSQREMNRELMAKSMGEAIVTHKLGERGVRGLDSRDSAASRESLHELRRSLPTSLGRGSGRGARAARAHAAKHSLVGSTQVDGCPGDFCSFDLAALNEGDATAAEFLTGPGPSRRSETLSHNITYMTIVRARSEHKLVRLLLQRYRRGEEGDYLLTEYFSDTPVGLGQTFPAHYYRKMRICEQCFMVYSKIESARRRALRKIEQRQAKEEARNRASARRSGRAHASVPVLDDLGNVVSMAGGEDGVERSGVPTLGEIAELRGFISPPPTVGRLVSALMLAVTGEAHAWPAAKRAMANGERFVRMLDEADAKGCGGVPVPVRRALRVYARDRTLQPDALAPVASCAVAFATWLWGFLRADADLARILDEAGAPVIVAPRRQTVAELEALQYTQAQAGEQQHAGQKSGRTPSSRKQSKMTAREARAARAAAAEAAAAGSKGLSAAERSARRRVQKLAAERLTGPGATGASTKKEGKRHHCDDGTTVLPYRVMGHADVKLAKPAFVVLPDFFDTFDGVGMVFEKLVKEKPGHQVLLLNTPGQAHTQYPRAEARAVGRRPGSSSSGRPGSPSSRSRPGSRGRPASPGSSARPGSRGRSALGSSHSERSAASYKSGAAAGDADGAVLNNEFSANAVASMLRALESSGEFVTSSRPFFLIGFGNGASVAACLAASGVRSSAAWSTQLRGLLVVNGFTHVDPQLAAILHSSSNVFSCFPEDRPDLPISYCQRFLFSDAYLKRVTPALALNIYTAVHNPITLQGRVRICEGALRHRDIRDAELRELARVPLIVVQSTEDVLVNASHVDAWIKDRPVAHVWSHQETNADKAQKVQVRRVLGKLDDEASGEGSTPMPASAAKERAAEAGGAVVVWINAGHEVRQEEKPRLQALIEVLASIDDVVGPTPAQAAAAKKLAKKDARDRVASKSLARRDGGGAILGAATAPVAYEATQAVRASLAAGRKSSVPFSPFGSSPTFEPPTMTAGDDTRGSSSQFALTAPADVAKAAAAATESFEARQARLQQTEDEFQRAMRAHKRVKTQTASLLDSARSDVIAAVSQLPYSAASGEAAPDAPEGEMGDWMSQFHAEQKRKRVAQEAAMESQLEMLRHEQERRRRKWEIEDRERLHQIQVSLQARSQSRAMASSGRSYEIDLLAMAPQAQLKYDDATERGPSSSTPSSTLSFSPTRTAGSGFGAAAARRGRAAAAAAAAASPTTRRPTAAIAMEREAEIAQRTPSRSPSPAARASSRSVSPARSIASSRSGGGASESHSPRAGTASSQRSARSNGSALDAHEEGANVAGEVSIAGIESSSSRSLSPAGGRSGVPLSPEEQVAHESRALIDMDDYARVKQEQEGFEEERVHLEQEAFADGERRAEEKASILVQAGARMYFANKKCAERRAEIAEHEREKRAALQAQCAYRSLIARRQAQKIRENNEQYRIHFAAALVMQRYVRGHVGRVIADSKRRTRATATMQRALRGHLGRKNAVANKAIAERERLESKSASAIQSAFRGFTGRRGFARRRAIYHAAMLIQRVFRGHRGRVRVNRMQKWDKAEPGPERLQLGIEMIQESKQAFSRHKKEISALNRAQTRTEHRVRRIHQGLRESKKELNVIERELADIDQLDRELQVMVHDPAMIEAQKYTESDAQGSGGGGGGGGGSSSGGMSSEEAHDLQMALQLKRAERERKKQQLEAEFAGVFAEIAEKKAQLTSLQEAIGGMEATRQRKDREFQRLQRNLMELLSEQKEALDHLREKGVELETATATSAAAAAATAHAVQEQEKRSTAVFEGTEELLKFQFMSMSMSYFNSINMLKSMRDMNKEVTSTAIAGSAQTAAAAAAAATAANIPQMQRLGMGSDELLLAIEKKKDIEEAERQARLEDAKTAAMQPFPDKLEQWSVYDIGRWLDVLSLPQYKQAFKEAAVDGALLLELQPSDFRDVLGMEHTLHVKKVVAARDKMKPLSAREKRQMTEVVREDGAVANRREAAASMQSMGQEDVFRACRNGRRRLLEEALEQNFNIDTKDEHGNTLLMTACQQTNPNIVKMLVGRSANINLQNANGNTALHYAMAYDATGDLGEYLIGQGADDALENQWGLSPYDGITADDG